LLLGFFVHSLKRIEGSLKITLKGLTSLNNFLHDFKSLLFGDSWAKWISLEVSSDSNSSRIDHGAVLLRKISVFETFSTHVRGMSGVWLVVVVLFNDLVKELVELGVRIVGTSIKADTRVQVLNA